MDIWKTLQSKFTSHNAVEVERTTLTRTEYEELRACEQELAELRKLAYSVDQGVGGAKVTYKNQYEGASAACTAWKRACDDLKVENEKLRAENEKLTSALDRAVNDVEIWCDRSDEPEWTEQARQALSTKEAE